MSCEELLRFTVSLAATGEEWASRIPLPGYSYEYEAWGDGLARFGTHTLGHNATSPDDGLRLMVRFSRQTRKAIAVIANVRRSVPLLDELARSIVELESPPLFMTGPFCKDLGSAAEFAGTYWLQQGYLICIGPDGTGWIVPRKRKEDPVRLSFKRTSTDILVACRDNGAPLSLFSFVRVASAGVHLWDGQSLSPRIGDPLGDHLSAAIGCGI